MASHSAQLEEIREAEERVKSNMEEEATHLKTKLESMMDRVKELENELVLTESQFARAVAESEVRTSKCAISAAKQSHPANFLFLNQYLGCKR